MLTEIDSMQSDITAAHYLQYISVYSIYIYRMKLENVVNSLRFNNAIRWMEN